MKVTLSFQSELLSIDVDIIMESTFTYLQHFVPKHFLSTGLLQLKDTFL